MRPEPEHLHHLSNRPTLDQITGVHRTFHVESLAKVDHVFAIRFRDYLTGSRELIESGERRLVREVVLPRLHHPAANRPAF